MLTLDRVLISGFKSFPEPAELRIADGITAIVGPNGCGKSNLSDAITWVLGEQSAKSLRGAKMQDVIFSGSETRKPLGLAEVRLVLRAGGDFDRAVDGKVEISRRVFRDGGSQYRLNGKRVPLKEIKDLLMDTGLGIRAYSVIEQGKIGLILSGKPQERRKLLEEAAGITRYKARKRVAEVKLEEATANLLRLEDVVGEVQRALRSLKRQANAARRYQAKEAEFRELLDQVLRGRWVLLRDRLQGLETRIDAATERDAELTAASTRDEAVLTEGREALDQRSRALARRHEEQSTLAARIEGRQEFLKGARRNLTELGERLERGTRQASERAEEIDTLRSSSGVLDERTVELVTERDRAAQVVADDEEHIASAQKAVREAENGVATARRDLMTSLAEVNRRKGDLQRHQVEIEKRTMRQRFLAEERERLDRQLAEAQTVVETADAKRTAAETKLGEARDAHATHTEILTGLLERERELTERGRHIDSELSGLRQRRQILVELSERHVERRQALLAALAAIGIDEPRFLADELRVAAGWERGVDHYLGELTDAVLVTDDTDPLVLAKALSAENVSGVFLRPLADAPAPTVVDDPAIESSLATALEIPVALAGALPPAYLVAEPADAARLAAAHPGVAFITRERLWTLGGALRVQSDAAAPGVLARERELAEIDTAIPEYRTEREQLTATLRKLVEERSGVAASIQKLDEQKAELKREIAVAGARRHDAVARRDKIQKQHHTVAEEQDEIAREATAADDAVDQLSGAVDKATGDHKACEEALDSAQRRVATAKEERERLREESAGRRGQLNLLEERLTSHNQEGTRLARQVRAAEQRLEEWSRERENLEKRRDELGHQIVTAEEELQTALEARATAQEAVLAEQSKLDQQRDELRIVDERVQEVRAVRDELRNELEALRVDRASQRQDAEHLAVQYHEAFGRLLPGAPEPKALVEVVEPVVEVDDTPAATAEDETAEAAVAEAEVETEVEVEAEPTVEEPIELPEVDAATLAEWEALLAEHKAVLERLGPVNVLAAQEYDEQYERHHFLAAQRDDVTQSVERLKRTIREINEASSERFRETFAIVNRVFGETFSRLFRGGEAEMRLLDEDDLLETGIEIIARPPGKRPQNLMLLSGGEKALTAIALLFALFSTRPSPFCILDEVDAPLDDVNVLRYASVLQEMARDTQFLVITHNKLTMEIADTLYGVTMEERGVSKLVSVSMGKVQPQLEATA
ncbi:MAG: AAA family ATPase [Acidobacteriota bacterium]